MKIKLLSLYLTLTMLIQTAYTVSLPFNDVPSNHWASESVEYVYKNELMTGISNTLFQPNETLTRAMFITILGRMENVDENKYIHSSFIDVPEGQWYSSYVNWAAQTGVTEGTGDGKFSPNNIITREQMAAIIARYIDITGLIITKTEKTIVPFIDQENISSWAKDGVELMCQIGIFSGYEDNSFQPKKNVNRFETATVFMKLDMLNSSSSHDDNEEDNTQDNIDNEYSLSDLIGTYEGSYFTTQGEIGLTLTVYEEYGNYCAFFEFYNLPNQTNTEEGSFTMNVDQTSNGTFSFTANEWINRPLNYSLLNLEGVLKDDTLYGDSPISFMVTKISNSKLK